MHHKEELINKVRHLIGQDELEAAIDILSEFFHDNEALDDIILQSARYHNLQRELANGTIAGVEVKTELNTLRRNILAFIRMEEDVLQDDTSSDPHTHQKYETAFLLSLSRVKLVKLLLTHYEPDTDLTITALQELSGLKRRKLIVEVIRELHDMGYLDREKREGKTCWKLSPKGVAFFNRFSLESLE